jgi:chemotaxis-related protein WspD
MSLDHCWNTIGVRGDGSCSELTRHLHCHNCPAFSGAAQSLLDRDTPADYVETSTGHFAQPRVAVQRATQSVMIFRIGAEWLALPTSVVSEVGHLRQVHSLPHRRNHIEGVVNVHGELLVCVSLRRMLGLAEEPASAPSPARTPRSSLIVIHHEGVRAVCPVDEVHGIHQVQPKQLQDVPATVAKSASTYTRKVLPWRERSVGVLNEQLLFIALKRSLA